MTTARREIQYLVLPNAAEPYLLARVRWPDVYQAISAVRPDWQDDPGLFDLPYAPNSTRLTSEAAAELAAEWGARLPAEDEVQPKGPSLIRRMPSDWSKLSTAERRAWSIESSKLTRRHPAVVFATFEQPVEDEQPLTAKRLRRRQPKAEPVLAADPGAMPADPYPSDIHLPEPREAADAEVDAVANADTSETSSLVIDLTTGQWHVDPTLIDDDTASDGGSTDGPLAITFTAPTSKRRRRGRKQAVEVVAEQAADQPDPEESTSASVVDITDPAAKRLRRGGRSLHAVADKDTVLDLSGETESAGSGVDH